MDNNFPRLLWTPPRELKDSANITKYMQWLDKHYDLDFNNYQELWQWSVENPKVFWESIVSYFDVSLKGVKENVLKGDNMPDISWFEGCTLNYAEHIFRQHQGSQAAIIFRSEQQQTTSISWNDLEIQVGKMASFLREQGIKPGSRVVAFLPNIPEATIAFLACCSLGAIWSSCSPDFGASSVIDRFQQIEPEILIAIDGYQYNGKPYDKRETVEEIVSKLTGLKHVVFVEYLAKDNIPEFRVPCSSWRELMQQKASSIKFENLPFEHPIWVLYSSGTTGKPKAITHSHGGVLLEHLKYLAFHNDVRRGERFFWYSTTGWMMWNFVQASLLLGATVVLYDGSPAYPDLNVLWDYTAEIGINHFGTSAPYLVALMKGGIEPGKNFNLSKLRSIGSTGSPLPPEAFDYVYDKIRSEVWLCSISGGTDVCTAFVGGCPILPLYEGEIQCSALGCDLHAWDDNGNDLIGEVGEMVITKPMPSMPVFFWNDPNKERYRESYFEMYPGVWRHGDWVEITDRGSLIIYGRSDATLNRQGIRIGTAEIYQALNPIQEIKDSLIVNLELSGGKHYMPLFVFMQEGHELDDALKDRIRKTLRKTYTPRHVPDEIIEVPDIPYTISGKKMEAPVKKILLGRTDKSFNPDSMKNPDSMNFFFEMAKSLER